MLVRKILPLFIANVNNGDHVKGRTRFQKMLFLLQQKYIECDFQYDFHPYDYGPYSSTLHNDIDELATDNYLDELEIELPSGKITYQYSITPKGRRLVNRVLRSPQNRRLQLPEIYETCESIKEFANRVSLDELLEHIYSEYPSYAKFSVFEF